MHLDSGRWGPSLHGPHSIALSLWAYPGTHENVLLWPAPQSAERFSHLKIGLSNWLLFFILLFLSKWPLPTRGWTTKQPFHLNTKPSERSSSPVAGFFRDRWGAVLVNTERWREPIRSVKLPQSLRLLQQEPPYPLDTPAECQAQRRSASRGPGSPQLCRFFSSPTVSAGFSSFYGNSYYFTSQDWCF